MSATVAPTFTEVMTFDEPTPDHLHPRPRASRGAHRGGGEYLLRPEGTGTHVSIDLEIWCDLPLRGCRGSRSRR